MITFIQQPNKYTPVQNPIIFQIASDDSRIQYFTVQVQDNLGNIIQNLKIYTTPANRSGSYCDLSSILSNTVDYQLLPSANLFESTPTVFQAYQLVIIEKLYDTVSGGIINGTSSTTGIYYAWQGLIDRVNFSVFNYNNYVLTPTGTTTRFLTNKPTLSSIYRTSTEYLYFLNDGQAGNANIKFYGKNNLLIGNHNLSLSGHTSGCTRLDISPTTLNINFGIALGDDEFGDMFDTPFGSSYSISSTNYFTVGLTDLSGNTKSQVRTYALKDLGCTNIPVQILFSNQLGGYDSINFFNLRETIDVTKTSIAKNPFTLTNGVYSDNTNSVFNEENQVINVNSTSTYQVISDALRDVESVWLKELIKASKAFVMLSNGLFYPITITSLSYPVQQKKYNTALIRLQLTFTINDTGIVF